MNVTSTLGLSVELDSVSLTVLYSEDLPARISVRFPCPSDAIQFLVYCEVFKPEFMLEFMGHGNA